MPIRFRCAYCNQLMGIARRKAGTVVSCPTCQGQVVVPSPEPGMVEPLPLPPPSPSPSPSPSAREPSGGNVFERHDFDPGLFNPNPVPLTAPSPGPAFLQPMTAPAPKHKPALGGSEPFALPEPAASPRGMVLTPGKMVLVLVGGGVVGLILFGLGLLVGKSL